LTNLTNYKAAYNKLAGKKEILDEQKIEFSKSKASLEKRALAIEKAQVIIQQTAKATQEQLRFHIEDIVRSAMDAVFPDMYDFTLDFEIKRNKTEATLRFTSDGHDIDIMRQNGGGLVDTAALGLRLATWSLGNSCNTLILDESLKFLSSDLQPRMGEILKEIGDKLSLQLIFVSHSAALIESADKVFIVKLKDKVSKVEAR